MRITNALLACALAASLPGCHTDPTPPPAPLALGDDDTRIEIAGDGRTLTLRRGGDTLLVFPADGFQLGTVPELRPNASYDPWWFEPEDGNMKVPPPEGFAWHDVTAARIDSGSTAANVRTAVELDFAGGAHARLTVEAIRRQSGEVRFVLRIASHDVPADQAVAMIRLRPRDTVLKGIHGGMREGFYGLGEWGDDVNHRGHLRPMQLEPDLSFENATDENHVPVPLLVGTNGWGLFVESRRVGAFDVARKEPDLIEVTYGTAEQSGDGVQFHLFVAARALDITRQYYDLTGYPALPAQWALGPWFWRNENKDQAEVFADVQAIRDRDLASSAIWFDRPYATAVNTFDFDKAKFPDPSAMLKRAHDLGFRYAVWHTPYLEPAASALLAEANAKAFFPRKTSANLNKWGTPIDFTNPTAYAWWQSLIRKYTDDMGIEGFKLDYGEDIIAGAAGNRSGWTFQDGSDDRTMHHGYVTLYHQIYAETLPKSGGYLLCRTGRWGDQKNVSVIWPGDLDATWTKKAEKFSDNGKMVKGVGGLPASIADGLSLGASGFPFFAADTGGYIHSPAGKELWVRWLEQTALSTVMNIGDATSEQPWEYTADNGRDDEALAILKTYLRLHLRLFPYEWTHAQNIAKDGRPITRPLGLVYPELGIHPNDEYLFGDDLLVAPVVTPGAVTREIVLPPGQWLDWWTGKVYDGGMVGGVKVTVEAPLDRLPLLARRGAVIPLLRPTIDTMSPTTEAPSVVDSFASDAGLLWVRMVPPLGSFTVYDGTSFTTGGGATTAQSGAVFTKGAMLEIVGGLRPDGKVELPTSPAFKSYASLEELQQAESGWFAAPGVLWVKVPAGKQNLIVEGTALN